MDDKKITLCSFLPPWRDKALVSKLPGFFNPTFLNSNNLRKFKDLIAMVIVVEAINYQMYNMVYTKMILLNLVKFEWDQGNYDKNWQRHRVMYFEAEEAFFDDNKKIFEDPHHSKAEKRYILLGRTVMKRALFIVFTIRDNLVRVISARDLNKKEQKLLN